ncbi:hypothetical protein [Mucilaginibacter sp.]|jgi:hypothetical protein|uniref:hypothetical protein n=1 Tax=Mucilaginibacter sp. TaxID=1882438 RepID=UPI0035647066
MKNKLLYILLASVGLSFSAFAQTNQTGSLSEAYRNFNILATSSLNYKSLKDFKSIAGKDIFYADEWMYGGAVSTSNLSVSAGYQFNFNFMNHELYTKYKDSVIVIDNNSLKSFYLSDNGKKKQFYKYAFTGDIKFYELLSSDTTNTKIMLLKLRTVKEQQGYKSAGSNYTGDFSNKFVSNYEYYLLFPDNSFKRIKLSAESIQKNLSPDYEEKAKSVIKNHKKVNEKTAGQIIDELNTINNT